MLFSLWLYWKDRSSPPLPAAVRFTALVCARCSTCCETHTGCNHLSSSSITWQSWTIVMIVKSSLEVTQRASVHSVTVLETMYKLQYSLTMLHFFLWHIINYLSMHMLIHPEYMYTTYNTCVTLMFFMDWAGQVVSLSVITFLSSIQHICDTFSLVCSFYYCCATFYHAANKDFFSEHSVAGAQIIGSYTVCHQTDLTWHYLYEMIFGVL